MKRELKVGKNVPESVLKELKLGYINLSDGFFDLAQTNFDLVIIADPTCADAFWGLMLAKCQIRNEDVLLTNATLYKNIIFLKEYQNALVYADEDQKNMYNYLLSEILKINSGEEF